MHCYDTISLLKEVEEKIMVLKHTKEWTQENNRLPPAMVLVAMSQPNSQLEELPKLQTQLLTKPDTNKGHQNNGRLYNKWKHNAPENSAETKSVNFIWYTKYNFGKGKWVSTHDTHSHKNGFHKDQHQSKNNQFAH